MVSLPLMISFILASWKATNGFGLALMMLPLVCLFSWIIVTDGRYEDPSSLSSLSKFLYSALGLSLYVLYLN